MLARARRQPKRQTLQSVHVPAPMGGINTVSAGSAMPESDCIYLFNMLASEYGLRSRTGYREWNRNLSGAADLEVRSILPFAGSTKSGTNDKLFSVTSLGIWESSAEEEVPARLIDFPSSAGEAGYGVAHAFTTAAGKFLLYCDDTNGLYLWSETAAAWSKIEVGTTVAWTGSTAYLVGDRVTNGGNVYACTVAGTSAVSGGPTGTGAAIVDSGVTWSYVSAASSTVIGPSLADQRAGFTADPANFVHVTAWKNRLWFTERDSTRGWYLDINAIYGTATSFNFGAKMRAGGPLVGLYNWSYDGGGGLDTMLVGLSTAGDVVIYQGTDPSSASTFGLKGCWFVGAVPAGRRIATEYGGELLIASLIGIVPLSKLVMGGKTEDQSIYHTGKISNLFTQLASTRRSMPGWAIYIHPTDNALLVTHPNLAGGATEQLAMSFATRSWSRYRDLPILSGAAWAGEFWFGTADGRVCRSIDYIDNVQLDDPEDYFAVKWSVLSAYSNLGNARQKQVKMIRPTILSGAGSPTPGAAVAWVEATARYNYDLLEPTAPTALHTAAGWNFELWNTAVWGGDYSATQPITGAVGMGRDVAIAIRGNALSRTILVGWDVFFEQGGML